MSEQRLNIGDKCLRNDRRLFCGRLFFASSKINHERYYSTSICRTKLSQATATFFRRVATTSVASTKVSEHLEGSVNTKTYPGLKQLIPPGDTKRLNFFSIHSAGRKMTNATDKLIIIKYLFIFYFIQWQKQRINKREESLQI